MRLKKVVFQQYYCFKFGTWSLKQTKKESFRFSAQTSAFKKNFLLSKINL